MKNTVSMRFVCGVGEVGKMCLKGANVDMEIDCHVEYTAEEARINQDLINEQMDRLVADTSKYMQSIDMACNYIDPICMKIQSAMHDAREREAKNRSFINKLYSKLRKEEKKEEAAENED